MFILYKKQQQTYSYWGLKNHFGVRKWNFLRNKSEYLQTRKNIEIQNKFILILADMEWLLIVS